MTTKGIFPSAFLVAAAICMASCNTAPDDNSSITTPVSTSPTTEFKSAYLDPASTTPPGVIKQGQSAFGRDVYNPGITYSCSAEMTSTTLDQSAGSGYGITAHVGQVTLRMNGGRDSGGYPVTNFRVDSPVQGAVVIAHSARKVKGSESTLHEDDEIFGPTRLEPGNSYLLRTDTQSTNEGVKTSITFCFPPSR